MIYRRSCQRMLPFKKFSVCLEANTSTDSDRFFSIGNYNVNVAPSTARLIRSLRQVKPMKKIQKTFSLKIFVYSTTIILMVSAAFSLFLIHSKTAGMKTDLLQFGKLLSQVLSSNARIGVFSENNLLIEPPIKATLCRPNVLECATYNLKGDLLLGMDRSGRFLTTLNSEKSSLTIPREISDRLKGRTSSLMIESERCIQFWSAVYTGAFADFQDLLPDASTGRQDPGQIIGFVRVKMDKQQLTDAKQALIVNSAWIGLLFWGAGSLIAFLFSKRITIPLKRLTRAAVEIENGRTPVALPVQDCDEIGKLSAAFNHMADALKQRETALQRANDRLEENVRERTRQLEKTNQKLEQKIREKDTAEKKVRESRKKYESILKNIEEGYLEVDTNGNILFFNDPLCELLGYSRDRLLQMNVADFTDPTCREHFFEALKKAAETVQSVYVSDHRVFTSDQKQRVLDLSVGPILNCQNEPVGTRIVARDISERIEAEQQRLNLEKELEQAQRLKAVGTLAGGVAHDFNNILMGIQGNVSLMLLDSKQDHPFYDRIKNIEHCVETAAGVTKRLLGFARGGKYDIRSINLNEIITHTSKIFGRTRKEIEMHYRLASDLWTIKADQSQIEQVLLNIYINAWQAMPNGGVLTIETENIVLHDRDMVKEIDGAPGKYIKCTVTDTGTGMDEETKSRIFEPFFTTKKLGSGSGLGLASVFGIIENHDGSITVESTVGRGTAFSFILPTCGDTGEMPTKIKYPEPGTIHGKETILLIDDENLILDTSRLMLQKLGYTALTASSGQEGIALYREHNRQIDLVILDMIMPGLSGEKTFDRLKKENPEIKVLLSTGYSMNRQASRMLKAGCIGIIHKPYNLKELARKIADAFRYSNHLRSDKPS